jgi:hypothetical protein
VARRWKCCAARKGVKRRLLGVNFRGGVVYVKVFALEM